MPSSVSAASRSSRKSSSRRSRASQSRPPQSVGLPPEVELIEEITTANIFQQVNITQDENDEVSQTTSSFMSTQQLQAPLNHIMESVLGFDSNHVIYKILLENSITTLTGFMLLDVDIINLLETTYNEEKLNF